MKPVVAVPVSIPFDRPSATPLGIVDEIRQAVRDVKARHPALAASHLCDVSLRRAKGGVRLTLYFRPGPR